MGDGGVEGEGASSQSVEGERRSSMAAQGAIPRQVSEPYVTCNFLVASFLEEIDLENTRLL